MATSASWLLQRGFVFWGDEGATSTTHNHAHWEDIHGSFTSPPPPRFPSHIDSMRSMHPQTSKVKNTHGPVLLWQVLAHFVQHARPPQEGHDRLWAQHLMQACACAVQDGAMGSVWVLQLHACPLSSLVCTSLTAKRCTRPCALAPAHCSHLAPRPQAHAACLCRRPLPPSGTAVRPAPGGWPAGAAAQTPGPSCKHGGRKVAWCSEEGNQLKKLWVIMTGPGLSCGCGVGVGMLSDKGDGP